MQLTLDAYVTSAHFDRAGQAIFALGDGRVRFESGEEAQAHDGAVLAAALHPSGEGLVTGGDDGKLVWTRPLGAETLAELKTGWIEAVAASPESGLIAFVSGRDLHLRDANDAAFARTFAHPRSVTDIAFDPKGRRLAAATYGGVNLWYGRIADQKPAVLKWAGSHTGVAWSPDGKFIITAMQDSQLHGWRVADEKNLRMGGYPAKIRSLAFMSKGALLATSGANGLVAWPFAGANGPMGKQAAEVGYDEAALVLRVAAALNKTFAAAGLDDGRVWVCDLTGQSVKTLKAEKGEPVSALAMSADARRVAWGCEDGQAGVAEID
jgi:WD40 repeat protein